MLFTPACRRYRDDDGIPVNGPSGYDQNFGSFHFAAASSGCTEGGAWQISGKIAMMAGCRRWRACSLAVEAMATMAAIHPGQKWGYHGGFDDDKGDLMR